MATTEVLTDESLLKSAQNQPEQTHTRPEHTPFLEGAQYWSRELMPIMSTAVQEAKSIEESSPAGKPLPAWVVSVTQRFGKMQAEAAVFSKKVEADSLRVDEGQLLEGAKTMTESVERWFRSLGPTNNSEDIGHVLLDAVDVLASEPKSPRRSLLVANLIEDAALRVPAKGDRVTLLQEASKSYTELTQGDIADPNVRAAVRQKIDCDHQLLRLRFEAGAIDEKTFYHQYEVLQTQSIRKLQEALARDNVGLGDGELLEWASLIFLRHRYWSRETAENYDVRAALLREDQAIYPWILEGGQNPTWSFDTVVQSVENPLDVTRVQLKAGHFIPGTPRYRSYLPTVVRRVVSELEGGRLRQLVSNAIGAIKNTYDSFRNPNMLSHPIDESALRTVTKIFEQVVS